MRVTLKRERHPFDRPGEPGAGSASGSLATAPATAPGRPERRSSTTAPDSAEPAPGTGDITGDVAAMATHEPAHVATARLGALGAEFAAGRLTPHEVTAALIDHLGKTTGGPAMDAAERAELRELLTDLVTNDPYLAGLVGRL